MEEIDNTCIICSEDFSEQLAVGVVSCDHGPYCHKCIFKMIVMSGNANCPICQQSFSKVMITQKLGKQYSECNFEKAHHFNKKNNIYAEDKETLEIADQMNTLKCIVPGCKEDQIFANMNLLEQHLEVSHRQVLCQLCLEFNMCVLSEQKLYSNTELERHLRKGDCDQDGNVYLLHPFCPFCKMNFYDEDKFLKHLQDHFLCNLCDQTQQFRYYKDYKSLEVHFQMSHYLCDDPACLEMGFVAYQTQTELELHLEKVHGIGQKQDKKMTQVDKVAIQHLTGFFKDSDGKNKTENQIQDREGVEVKNQLLSQRPKKMLTNHIGEHFDCQIDLRDFYHYRYNEEARIRQWDWINAEEDLRHANRTNRRQNNNTYQQKNKPPPKTSKFDEQAYLEDIPIYQMGQITFPKEVVSVKQKHDQLYEKLEKLLSPEQMDSYDDLFEKFKDKKLNIKTFFQQFVQILGEFFGYLLFPHFIACHQEKENLCKHLDDVYYQGICSLPRKNKNTVNNSILYSEMFKMVNNEIEQSLIRRIESGELDLRSQLRTQSERIKQFVEILKRVSVTEMAKLKMAGNFGVSIDAVDIITQKIYFVPLDQIQTQFAQIPDNDLIHVYIYYMLCSCFIRGEKTFQGGRNSVSNSLLNLFLGQYPSIAEKYYKKTKEEQQDDQEEELKKPRSLLVEEHHSNARDFDTGNKFDFPDIVKNSQKDVGNTQNQPQPNKYNANEWNQSDKPLIVSEGAQVSSKVKNEFKEQFPSIPEMSEKPKKDILEQLDIHKKLMQKGTVTQAHSQFEEEQQDDMDEETREQTKEMKAYGKKVRRNKQVYLIPGNFK